MQGVAVVKIQRIKSALAIHGYFANAQYNKDFVSMTRQVGVMKFRALSKNAPKTLRKGADFWIATQGVSFACNDVKKARLKFSKARNDKILECRAKTSTAFFARIDGIFLNKKPKNHHQTGTKLKYKD